ncbi:P-loop containing nucleoside triphosphate hydrolase protein, partial [Rozella allomycis CSF55]
MPDPRQQHFALSWFNISFTIKERKRFFKEEKKPIKILENVSGTVKPGEMVAILGASGKLYLLSKPGSGKTSLLNILAGRTQGGIIEGKVLVVKISYTQKINNKPRQKDWRRRVAFVEQLDLLYEHLTVYETVLYAAYLRLSGKTNKEKEAKVVELLRTLGILHRKDAFVGGRKKFISGGERKRVCIAIELVTDPKILFLDEPTSGLDSANALSLIEVLRQLCQTHGSSVLLTIHQPRYNILKMFDKIILLGKGKVAYSGSIDGALNHFQSINYPIPPMTNPADHFLDITTIDRRTRELEIQTSKNIDFILSKWNESRIEYQQILDGCNNDNVSYDWALMYPQEVWTLFTRYWKETIRYTLRLFAFFFQIVFLTVILGLVFLQIGFTQQDIQNRVGVLFFIIINIAFTTLTPLINEFPLEKPLIVRERFSKSFRISSLYIAKVLAGLPILLLGNFIYGSALYWMIGLKYDAGAFFSFLTFLVGLVIFSQAFGLFIGALADSPQVGQIIGPTFLIIFVIFGGNFANLETIPSWFAWLLWLSP